MIIGSHVQKTTQQLEALLQVPGITPLELDVEQIDADYSALLAQVTRKIEDIHRSGDTVVIFTSRQEKQFASRAERLEFGVLISDCLIDIVRNLPETIGFMISKGGITSNDVLGKGLNLRTSRVVGQILPGCSVVRCPHFHNRYPDLPVVIFPGNVGDTDSLARAHEYLAISQHADINFIEDNIRHAC